MIKTCVIVLCLLFSCSSKRGIGNEAVGEVECVHFVNLPYEELLSKPMLYNGKKISIDGYYFSDFEESALYNVKKHDDRGVGLWINFDDKLNLYQQDGYKRLIGRKLKVSGIFDASSHGHLNQYLGELHALCINEIE